MNSNDKHLIRKLFDDCLQMYATRDNHLADYFSKDFSGFTCVDNFLIKNSEDWLTASRQGFRQPKKPTNIESKELSIQILTDAFAILTAFLTLQVPTAEQAQRAQAVRLVLILHKESSGWKVVHGSISTPYIDNQQAEDALRKSEAHFRMMTENAADVVWKLDADYRFTYISPADEKRRGYSAAEVIGHHVFEMFDDEGIASITRAAQQRHEAEQKGMQLTEVTFEARHRCKDGSWIWGEICYNPEFDSLGKVIGFYGMSRVITERKQMQDQVRQLAFYDPLTKLPNRNLLNDRLSQAMAASKRTGCYGALMFLDLDNFKPINDSHGHIAGDFLLFEAAQRLKKCVRETDTISRFGGDEFIVVLSELNTDEATSYKQAQAVAEKIRISLAEIYQLTLNYDGKASSYIEHLCTASIGVTLFLGQEICIDELFKRADASMYKAKESGRNSVRFYSPAGYANKGDSE